MDMSTVRHLMLFLIILSNLCYSNNTRACEQSITIQLQILVTGTYLPHTRCTIFVPGFMASLLLRAAYDGAVSRIGTQAKLVGNASRNTWMMTSSFDKAQSKISTLLVDNNFTYINSATTGSWALNSQYVLRPVLTIFEGE